MRNRKTWLLLAVLIAISSCLLLITGSSLLTLPVDSSNSVPLGTFITWAGLIAFPMSFYLGVKEFRKPTGKFNMLLSLSLKFILLLALLWVPISYLLAGNLSFSFTEKATFQGGQLAMRWFWLFTYGIFVVPIVIYLLYQISRLFGSSKNI